MEKANDIIYERLYVRRGSADSNGLTGGGRLFEITETIKELPSTVSSAVKSSLEQWHSSSARQKMTRRRASMDLLLTGERSVEETIKELPSPSSDQTGPLPGMLISPSSPKPPRRLMQRRRSEDLILSSSKKDGGSLITFPQLPHSTEQQQQQRSFPARRRMVMSRRRASEDLILSGKTTRQLQELHKMTLQKNAKNLLRRRSDESQREPLVDEDEDEDDSKSSSSSSSGDIEPPPKAYHASRRRSDSNLVLPSLYSNNKKILQKRRLTPVPGFNNNNNNTETPKHVAFHDDMGDLDFIMTPRKCNSISEGQSLHDSLEQLNGPELSTSEKIERFLKSLNISDENH